MTESTALTVTEQREITLATPQIIKAIVDITCNSEMEKVKKAQMLLFCHENNLPYNLAFNGGLYIVNGRMAVEGDVIRSKVSQSGKYHQKVEHSDNGGCTLSVWQKASSGWPYHLYDGGAQPGDWVKMGEVSFTEEDATRAGLIKKDTYQKYSIDMYLNRATSRARRFFMSDLFNQPVYVHGEIEGTDFQPDPNAIEGEVVPQVTYNEAMAKLRARFEPAYGDKLDEAIQETNGGIFPHTVEQLRAVWTKLENGNDNS